MVDDADLKEIRESYADDEAAWRPIREQRKADVKALSPASTWDEKDRAAREEAGRPCLSFDELGQYVNQLVNDARETKRAVEVNPAGDEATEDVARFYGALIRQIEDRSNAQMAYAQMFEDAASGSYGWLRIKARYLQQRVSTPSRHSFDQELVIEAVPNPDTVTPGHFMQPDLSDCTRIWVHEFHDEASFKRRFRGKTTLETFRGIADVGLSWCDGKGIWVRELWRIKTRARRLVLLPPDAGEVAAAMAEGREPEPVVAWAEDLDADTLKAGRGWENFRERQVDEPYVCQTITNGVEILEDRDDWPGRFLPIIGCVGKTLWLEQDRQILSLIRNALGPQQLYNYYRTTEAEIVAMTPKAPWFAYKGALDPTNLAALASSNQVPVGVVEVDPSPKDWPAGTPMPPAPQRNLYEPPIQAFEIGAESTRRSIQSATGTGFLPTAAQRQNEKSGVALREIATSAAKGAYHFVDNFERAIRRVGVVLVDLIPAYYDTPRGVHVKGLDGKTQQIRINDPSAPAPADYGGRPLDLTQPHEFDITLSTGPSYATERDKASEFADQLIMARPEVFQIIGPDVIRLKNLGPLGDQIAKYLEAMQPPAIQALRQGGQPLPPQAQQAMAQLQQAQQMIAQLQQVIQSKQVEEQGKRETQLALKQLDGQIRLAIVELQGRQKLEQAAVTIEADAVTREDEQAHEMALKGADTAATEARAQQAAYEASKARLFGGGGGGGVSA